MCRYLFHTYADHGSVDYTLVPVHPDRSAGGPPWFPLPSILEREIAEQKKPTKKLSYKLSFRKAKVKNAVWGQRVKQFPSHPPHHLRCIYIESLAEP